MLENGCVVIGSPDTVPATLEGGGAGLRIGHLCAMPVREHGATS
jgi:hypothetical protein